MSKSTKSAKKRVNVQNLPTAEQELTKKEAKKVKGGSGIISGTGTVDDPFVMAVKARPKPLSNP